MKKLLKIILSFIIIVFLAILGYWIYLKFFVKITQKTAIDAVPKDAFIIIQTNDLFKAYNDLTNTDLWQHLLNTKYFSDIASDLQQIDKYLKTTSLPQNFFQKRSLIASVHVTGKTWDILYIIDLKDLGKISKQLDPLLLNIPEYKTFKLKYKINNNSYTIYKLVYLPNQYEKIYVAFAENLLLISYTKQLIINSLKALDEKFWTTNLQLLKLQHKLSPNADLQIITNFKQFDKFIATYQTQNDPAIDFFSQNLGYGAFEVKINNNTITLDGWTQADTSAPYLNALIKQNPTPISVYKILPDQTASFVTINFQNFDKFFNDLLNNYKQQDPKEAQQLLSYLKTLDKIAGINLKNDLLSLISNELAIAKLAPSQNERMQDLVITIKTKNPDSAQAKLDTLMRKIKAISPFTFKTITYKGYKIGYLKISGLFNLLLGNMLSTIDRPYYTIINNFIVFSNSPQVLERIIDNYLLGYTLERMPKFKSFITSFKPKTTISTFIIMPNLYQTLYKYATPEEREFLKENKDLIISFCRIGMQLITKNQYIRLILKLQYDPKAKLDVILHKLEKETEIERLLQQIDSLTFKIQLNDTVLQNSGQITVYYPGTKQIHYQGQAQNGQPVGLWRAYYPSGNLKITELFGRNGKLNGQVQFFYDNKANSILAQFNIENDQINGTVEEFYPSGQLKASISYKNGRKNGKAIFYYPDGKIKIKGHYKKGQKHGTWIYYDTEGNIIAKETWKNGLRLRTN